MKKKRRIEFSLLYRDMWQSSGKYVPRVDQLKRIAPVIIDMGCFARIESNGGAFEQVNLLFGENPNTAVREWVKPFNKVGIKTHMLERALNGIRMFPVPADVRQLMYKVKKAQGVDIARSFCGLNDPRNLELSIKYAKEAGMISQAALSITHSKVHTVEHFMNVVDKAVEYGTDEICLKDMAGIGRPVTMGKLVHAIKKKHPKLIVQYHGHSGPGFSVASMLEVAKAGADIIDVAMEPLSWGMVHPDVITIRHMLDDAGFDVPEIDMNAYMEARALTQEFIDDFLGYFIDPKNRYVSSLMIDSGLPGGMMGSLMADLKGMHQAINSGLEQSGKKTLSEDELLIKLFEEVAYIWPLMGYPPLVTPFSQYVKNTALVNILTMSQSRGRFEMMDDNTWDMLLGKAGNLPGKIDPLFVTLAKEQNRKFYKGVPQKAYPDALDKYRKEMKENGWDTGKDDEELFEFAMHETQYRDYKSGIAKKRFEDELAKLKAPKIESKPEGYKAPEPKKTYTNMKADKNIACIASLLHSLNKSKHKDDCKCCASQDIWSNIGYWRNDKEVKFICNSEPVSVILEAERYGKYNLVIGNDTYNCIIDYSDDNQIDFTIADDTFNAKVSENANSVCKLEINSEKFEIKRLDFLPQEATADDDYQDQHETDEDSQDSESNTADALTQSIELKSPMPGKVFKIEVKEGDAVKKGDVLLVIEAMKMENRVIATGDGIVQKIFVSVNDMVESTTSLISLGACKAVSSPKSQKTVKVAKTADALLKATELKSPMPGKVFKLFAKDGDIVKKGDVLLIIEAMKMENRVLAPGDAMVQKVFVKENDMVESTTILVSLGAPTADQPVKQEQKKEEKKTEKKEEKPVEIPIVKPKPKETPKTKLQAGEIAIKSPMPGTVFKIEKKTGDKIKKGDTILIIESMKMENRVLAEKDGVLKSINVALGDRVESTTILAILK
jgi:pyruvate carboxylase subunit B